MRTKRTKVVYWNTIPSPYMADRWNAIVDEGSIELEVWFSAKGSPDRSWKVDPATWKFKYRYVPGVSLLGRRLRFPTLVVRTDAEVLISMYADPVYLFGTAIGRLKGMKTGFWVEPTSDTWQQRSWWKELVKRRIFPRMSGLITTGKTGRAFCRRYGAEDARIFEAPYCVDVEYFKQSRNELMARREQIRKELNVDGAVFLYVGRLWRGKGLDTLIDAFEIVRKKHQNTSLLLVGDGVDEQVLRSRVNSRSIPNVIFHPFMQWDSLPKAYCASDVFVFPTLGDPYGLVVDEAMASSLPIISTSAAGEIDARVIEDVNGFVVPPNDVEALVAAMERLASNPSQRDKLGRESSNIISGNNPAKFASNFRHAIETMLGSNK